ncbi:MAG: hypothetical protein KBD76_09320 [Bacteriovorax sp.]|nr:hypothetical protein [Bacteriovorax sp.]
MMGKWSNLSLLLIIIFSSASWGEGDIGNIVAGGEVEDVLGKMEEPEVSSAYLQQKNKSPDNLENKVIDKNARADFIFQKTHEEITLKNEVKSELGGVGYTVPGTYEKKENYIDVDKGQMASDFRSHSSGAINFSFIQNNYRYESQNDIINKTISEGYKHVKGGALYLRGDQYFFRRDFVNTFWSLGGGLGFNSGRGLFITGEQSSATIRLWEIPVDLGLGVEIPLYHWFKMAATAGPSVEALYQNRSDYSQGEKGKNKIQVSYGQFANAQFKFNLTGFSSNTAYQLFTESRITNLLLNLEVRYQDYRHFQDPITISGTSFGVGFTFEYL